MRGSFWKKDSLITYILFELQPITIFSPVANFGDQSLFEAISLLYHSFINIFPRQDLILPVKTKFRIDLTLISEQILQVLGDIVRMLEETAQ